MSDATMRGYIFAEGLTDAAAAGAESLVADTVIIEERSEDKEH